MQGFNAKKKKNINKKKRVKREKEQEEEDGEEEEELWSQSRALTEAHAGNGDSGAVDARDDARAPLRLVGGGKTPVVLHEPP